MRTDSRISRVLHALIHMESADGPLTSETLAAILGTNAVVVRRLLGGLREHGYVQAEKGHGGGWTLGKALDDITLLEVYDAVGEPPLFSDLVSEDHPECAIERAVNAHLSQTMRAAQASILEKFGAVTIGALAREANVPKMRRRKAG